MSSAPIARCALRGQQSARPSDFHEHNHYGQWPMCVLCGRQVKQRGGGPEQTVVADIAFDALKIAWAKFETGELRGGATASQAVHI